MIGGGRIGLYVFAPKKRGRKSQEEIKKRNNNLIKGIIYLIIGFSIDFILELIFGEENVLEALSWIF